MSQTNHPQFKMKEENQDEDQTSEVQVLLERKAFKLSKQIRRKIKLDHQRLSMNKFQKLIQIEAKKKEFSFLVFSIIWHEYFDPIL